MVVSGAKVSRSTEGLISLAGVTSVGVCLLQFIILNIFSIVGPSRHDTVSFYFYQMPVIVLTGIEVFLILVPLALYAHQIAFDNRQHWYLRVSSAYLFVFVLFQLSTTIGKVSFFRDSSVVNYASMQDEFTRWGGLMMVVYGLGILAATYHLAHAVCNLKLPGGIVPSESAKKRLKKFSLGLFIVVTFLGFASIVGFRLHRVHSFEMEAIVPVPIET